MVKKTSVYTKVTALRKAKTYRVQKNIARRFLVFEVVEPNEYFYKCNFKTFLIYPAYAMLLPRRVFLSSKRFDALLEIDRQFHTAQQRLFLPLMRWNENLCIRIIHIPHSTPTKKKTPHGNEQIKRHIKIKRMEHFNKKNVRMLYVLCMLCWKVHET